MMNGTEAIEKCEYDKERFGIDLSLPSLDHKDFYLSLLNPFQIYSTKDENVLWSEKKGQHSPRISQNLTGYLYVDNCWDKIFYKKYDQKMNYTDAKARCESDGTFLAIPKSKTENDFFAGLIKADDFWIGINDIEKEGNFVAVDGTDLSYENWHPFEPNDDSSDDGVEIRWWDNGRWNDVTITEERKFICSINIKGENFCIKGATTLRPKKVLWLEVFLRTLHMKELNLLFHMESS